MHSTKIEALRVEYEELVRFCQENSQVSFAMYIDNTYKKSLLLAAASYFESVITNSIHDFANTKSKQSVELVSFIDNKAIKRQYHTFFNWDANNTNQFWGLFGEEFKRKAKIQIREKNLGDAESAFLAIGRDRNLLVHQNYIEAPINDTFDEIYFKYSKACEFVDLVTQMLSV